MPVGMVPKSKLPPETGRSQTPDSGFGDYVREKAKSPTPRKRASDPTNPYDSPAPTYNTPGFRGAAEDWTTKVQTILDQYQAGRMEAIDAYKAAFQEYAKMGAQGPAPQLDMASIMPPRGLAQQAIGAARGGSLPAMGGAAAPQLDAAATPRPVPTANKIPSAFGNRPKGATAVNVATGGKQGVATATARRGRGG